MTRDPLFPLPIEPFEYYMVSDERPGYPMTIPTRFDVTGQIDREAFRAALDETVDAHPLLKCILKRVPRKGLSWQLVDGWQAPINWDDGAPELELDIRKEPGLRVWVRNIEGGAEVTLVFHHACCDGIAVIQFVGDLLAAYARLTANEDQASPKKKILDPELLRKRGQFPVELPEPVSMGTIVRETMKEAYRWLRRPATPLAVPSTTSPPDGSERPTNDAGFIWGTLSAEAVQRYREQATSLGVTLNDLLLRDMFLTVRTWNESHNKDRPGGLLRITMPTSLRNRTHRKMPIANAISYAFLTRPAHACKNPTPLLQGIQEETAFIKDWHVSLMFLNAIAVARRIPFLTLAMSRSKRRCYSTTNLSYLGDFPRLFRTRLPRRDGKIVAGNLILERLLGAPPVRPQTHITLAILGYRGELYFCTRVDTRALPPPYGQQFLDTFIGHIRQSLENETEPDNGLEGA